MNPQADRVEVVVEYHLAEYKRVLLEFIPLALARETKKPNRLLPWNWPYVEKAAFALMVPPVFWLKKAMIGACVFTFDESGISRASKGRIGRREWSQVKAVHKLSEAYLIELKEGGAMPVPYRVFTAEGRESFENLTHQVAQSAA
jgi:hypothetical protein